MLSAHQRRPANAESLCLDQIVRHVMTGRPEALRSCSSSLAGPSSALRGLVDQHGERVGGERPGEGDPLTLTHPTDRLHADRAGGPRPLAPRLAGSRTSWQVQPEGCVREEGRRAQEPAAPSCGAARIERTACGASSAPHLVSHSMVDSLLSSSPPVIARCSCCALRPPARPSPSPRWGGAGPGDAAHGPSGSRRQASAGDPPVCQSISRMATIFNSVISRMA